jgi:hypothetical protein
MDAPRPRNNNNTVAKIAIFVGFLVVVASVSVGLFFALRRAADAPPANDAPPATYPSYTLVDPPGPLLFASGAALLPMIENPDPPSAAVPGQTVLWWEYAPPPSSAYASIAVVKTQTGWKLVAVRRAGAADAKCEEWAESTDPASGASAGPPVTGTWAFKSVTLPFKLRLAAAATADVAVVRKPRPVLGASCPPSSALTVLPLELSWASASVFSKGLLADPSPAEVVVFSPMRDATTGATWWLTRGASHASVAVAPADPWLTEDGLHSWHLVGIEGGRCALIAVGEKTGARTPVGATWLAEIAGKDNTSVAFELKEGRNEVLSAEKALPVCAGARADVLEMTWSQADDWLKTLLYAPFGITGVVSFVPMRTTEGVVWWSARGTANTNYERIAVIPVIPVIPVTARGSGAANGTWRLVGVHIATHAGACTALANGVSATRSSPVGAIWHMGANQVPFVFPLAAGIKAEPDEADLPVCADVGTYLLASPPSAPVYILTAPQKLSLLLPKTTPLNPRISPLRPWLEQGSTGELWWQSDPIDSLAYPWPVGSYVAMGKRTVSGAQAIVLVLVHGTACSQLSLATGTDPLGVWSDGFAVSVRAAGERIERIELTPPAWDCTMATVRA